MTLFLTLKCNTVYALLFLAEKITFTSWQRLLVAGSAAVKVRECNLHKIRYNITLAD